MLYTTLCAAKNTLPLMTIIAVVRPRNISTADLLLLQPADCIAWTNPYPFSLSITQRPSHGRGNIAANESDWMPCCDITTSPSPCSTKAHDHTAAGFTALYPPVTTLFYPLARRVVAAIPEMADFPARYRICRAAEIFDAWRRIRGNAPPSSMPMMC